MTESQNSPILQASGLHKAYRVGGQDLKVLQGVDTTVRPGEWVAILGRSGSGKSTLLHLLGGLDRPDRGSVRFGDQEVFSLSPRKLDLYRARHAGFVFQAYHLMPELTALENVTIASLVAKHPAKAHAEQLLSRVGLGERLKHRPNKLSGGERQRVAIARALVNQPELLLADEPTGNLDADTGRSILDLFQALHDEGQTIVMVTHDENIADRADRVLRLTRGRLDTSS